VIEMNKTKFLKVMCTHKVSDNKICGNEQIVFNKAAMRVKCLVCGSDIAIPRGGKAKIKAKVIKTFE